MDQRLGALTLISCETTKSSPAGMIADTDTGAVDSPCGPITTLGTVALALAVTLLRSVVQTGFCHQQGTHQLLTGFPERVLRRKRLYPDLFSVTNKVRYRSDRQVPNYVGVGPVNFLGPSYLGNAYDVFSVTNDPNLDNFSGNNLNQADQATATNISRRINLRKQLDQLKQLFPHRQE